MAGVAIRLTLASSDEGASPTGRQWFRRPMEGYFERLKPDAHDDPALDRVAVAADHALTLANVSEADVGFYVCHDNEEAPTRYRMEYLLDGDEQQHKKYLEELQEAYENMDLEGPLQRYGVTTSWDDWEDCDRCGEVGLRKRYGRCQLRTSIDALYVPPGAQVALNITVPMMGPSCRSALLRRYAMSRKLYAFPDFVQTEYCQEPCDEEFRAKHTMSPVNKSFFGQMSVEKAEDEETAELDVAEFKRVERPGTNIKLICPGVSGPGVAVTWFHNGSKLRPTWSRVSLNAASQEVMFKPLKERDAGTYECTVMGVKMGHLELFALGMSDASWFTLVTVLANFCVYLAVVSANWNQHYRRLEIQEYLAAKRLRSIRSRESRKTGSYASFDINYPS
ncbi:hypothetical protein HPB50_004807 [Hyalomma asiaticum]|uniref:Uncharacterized protein n=1 Tax=Hyalomma asiaticum TaxID=266040 RepID=A0ACB7SN92_HYAAI|nr:hypothetical protein HPB50_004807 [Hyalomma asiaticum]